MNYKKSFFTYLLVYLLLLFQAGFVFTELYSRYTNIMLLLLVIIYINQRKKKTSNECFFFAGATLFLQLITYIVRGFPEINLYISTIVDVLTALLFVIAIDRDTFKHVFSNINYAICIASLLCFVLYFINVPLYKVFPILSNSYGAQAHYAILSFPRADWANYRIQGIYWEPGAFQFFIVLSALFDMFGSELDVKQIRKRFIVYLLTIFFTYSTTGIFCGFILLLLYIYKFSKHRVVWLSLVGVIIIAVVSYGLIVEGSYLYYTLFGKLETMNDAYLNGETGNASADVRVNSIVYVLDEFIKSPIVGIGVEGHAIIAKHGFNETTFTPLMYFAEYGLLLGIIHVTGLIKFMSLRKKRIIETVLVLLVVVFSSSSELFAFNPILMCFSMYGLMKYSTRTGIIKEHNSVLSAI